VARIVYWVNGEGPAPAEGSIAWARLDGSGGGVLNTTGAAIGQPYRIALDAVHGRVYWANNRPNPRTISFANTDNTGGGNLSLTGATPPPSITGLAVDPEGGRLYWINSNPKLLSFASLSGGGGGDLSLDGAAYREPFGLALDPTNGSFYWGNLENNNATAGAIGFLTLNGAGGGITPATAPVDGPQDPLILKSPAGTGAPRITAAPSKPAALSCSTGTWAADFPGSFVYRAPRTFSFQWTLGGSPIAGALAPTLQAEKAGPYACVVTGSNQAGSAAQTSSTTTIDAAKARLTVRTKRVRAKAGKQATFRLQAQNEGDLESDSVRLCVKAPKKARGILKARCASLGKLAALGGKTARLRVRVGPAATGSFKLKIVPRGIPGRAAKVTLKVIG
jgi:hypothetical protein